MLYIRNIGMEMMCSRNKSKEGNVVESESSKLLLRSRNLLCCLYHCASGIASGLKQKRLREMKSIITNSAFALCLALVPAAALSVGCGLGQIYMRKKAWTQEV